MGFFSELAGYRKSKYATRLLKPASRRIVLQNPYRRLTQPDPGFFPTVGTGAFPPARPTASSEQQDVTLRRFDGRGAAPARIPKVAEPLRELGFVDFVSCN